VVPLRGCVGLQSALKLHSLFLGDLDVDMGRAISNDSIEAAIATNLPDSTLGAAGNLVRGKGGKNRIVPIGQHAAHYIGLHLEKT
jgi:hypothetical protein